MKTDADKGHNQKVSTATPSTAELAKNFTTEREVLSEIADIKRRGLTGVSADEKARLDAQAERLNRLYRALRDSRNVGEAFGYDPAVVAAPTYTPEEREALYLDAQTAHEMHAALAARIRDEASTSPLALPMPTYSLTRGVPLVLDEEGNPTEDVSDREGEYLPGLSTPRFCLGGLVRALGRDVRAVRLVGWVPVAGVTSQTAEAYGIPVPGPEDMAEINRHFAGVVSDWQRYQVERRILAYCREHDMLPVAAPPRGGARSNGLAEVTVTLASSDFVREVCSYTGPEGQDLGREQVHYLQVVFSNGDVQTRRVEDPVFEISDTGELVQTGVETRFEAVPDYRFMNYLALTPEEMDPVSELLGVGPFVSDGSGFVFSSPITASEMAERALSVEGVDITEGEARRRARAYERRRRLEFQFRATEISPDGEVLFLTKGMLTSMSRASATMAVERFEDEFLAIVAEMEVSPSGSPERKTASDALAAFVARYQPAWRLLQEVASCPNEVALIVRGDQIKVGAGKATGALRLCDHAEPFRFGALAVVGTYLKGTPGDVEDLRGDGADRLQLVETVVEGLGTERVTCVSLLSGDHAAVWAGPKKPTQYKVSGNSQVLQFADNRTVRALSDNLDGQVRAVADALTTPQGVASLVSDEEAYRRRDLEARMRAVDAGEDVTPMAESHDELDMLKEALRTRVIRLTSEGETLQIKGRPVPAGHLRMPAAILSRVDSLVAARVKRLLRSMGLSLYGYHHRTGADSVSLMRALWGLERWSSRENVLSDEREADYRRAFVQRTAPEYPFLDASTVFTPAVITGLENADDDGDITFAIATHLWVPGPGPSQGRRSLRYVKVVLLGRYPMVDAPILWMLPAGVPTPWDAHSADEDAVFAAVIGALRPEVPVFADLHGDDVVLGESDRITRLSDKGAKANVNKKKFVGPVTAETAFDLVRRKWALNSTGALTRRHERLSVVLNATLQALDTGRFDFGQGPVPIHRPRWEAALEDYLERGASIMELLELQLTGFKYDTAIYQPPSVALGDGFDPFGFVKGSDVIEAIPLDYHGVIDAIRVSQAKYHRDGRDTCLAVLTKSPQPFYGMGKEVKILNYVLVGKPNASGIGFRGGAVRRVVATLGEVRTEIQPFLRDLKARLDQFAASRGETGYKASPETMAEARVVLQALNMWREYWREVMAYRQTLLDSYQDLTEGLAAAETWVGHAAEAIRFKMRKTADQVSDEALVLAIYNFWKSGHDALTEDARPLSREQYEQARARANNAASVMALIEGRMSQVFEAGRVRVEVKATAQAAICFTRTANFPGPAGGQIQFDGLFKQAGTGGGPDEVVARYTHPGTGVVEHFVLHPADGETGLSQVPFGEPLTATKQTARRCVLRW
jgi:hypothetical protein